MSGMGEVLPLQSREMPFSPGKEGILCAGGTSDGPGAGLGMAVSGRD